MLLSFERIPRPVLLVGCDELRNTIANLLRGWHIERIAAQGAPQPAITIKKTTKGYRRTSEWLSDPEIFTDRVDTVCDFFLDLIKLYLSNDNSMLCLHCAAVKLGDGLVVFPSSHGVGKSTLCTHLSAIGAKVFSDDVLPIISATNEGMAPGILPRLRLPLPEDSDSVFTDYVNERRGPHSDRFLYLDLKEEELAPLGSNLPIIGFVLLERNPDGDNEMTEAPTSEVLKSSILRNFSQEVSPLDILDRLHTIVDGARCFTLRYSSAKNGAELLYKTFSEAI